MIGSDFAVPVRIVESRATRTQDLRHRCKKTGPNGPVFGYVNDVARLRQSREHLSDDVRREIFARVGAAEIENPTSGAPGISRAH